MDTMINNIINIVMMVLISLKKLNKAQSDSNILAWIIYLMALRN